MTEGAAGGGLQLPHHVGHMTCRQHFGRMGRSSTPWTTLPRHPLSRVPPRDVRAHPQANAIHAISCVDVGRSRGRSPRRPHANGCAPSGTRKPPHRSEAAFDRWATVVSTRRNVGLLQRAGPHHGLRVTEDVGRVSADRSVVGCGVRVGRPVGGRTRKGERGSAAGPVGGRGGTLHVTADSAVVAPHAPLPRSEQWPGDQAGRTPPRPDGQGRRTIRLPPAPYRRPRAPHLRTCAVDGRGAPGHGRDVEPRGAASGAPRMVRGCPWWRRGCARPASGAAVPPVVAGHDLPPERKGPQP